MNRFQLIVMLLAIFVAGLPASGQEKARQPTPREKKVRDDLKRVTEEGFWIYNDLPAGFRKAKETGKPMLVVLRCLPCEECVKLDDELVDRDPVVRPLLEKFVCVRVVSTNGLDLSLFQFDTDQSFAVFLLNADKTIYGRFGTRSHHTEWIGDVSLPGLANALRGALELHESYPANRESLVGKQGRKPLFERPELFPSLKDKFTSQLNYEGDVVKSCIHCHQIGDAVRDYYRSRKEPLPQEVLYPYPHPKSIGLIFDPATRGTIKSVTPDTIAAVAGFQNGDAIQTLNSQPILSQADVQWVLESIPASGGTVAAGVSRNGQTTNLIITLKEGWRRLGDISWRVSSWGLRRMTTGGMMLDSVTAEELAVHKLPANTKAMKVQMVGKWGAHAAAKNAGFEVGDIIVSVDGRTDIGTETDLMHFGVTDKKAGDTVTMEIIRNGNRKSLKLPMQL